MSRRVKKTHTSSIYRKGPGYKDGKPTTIPAPLGNKFAAGHGFGRPKIYDDAFIEKEAQALLEWTEKEGSIWFDDFAIERGYSPQRFSEWAKQNTIFSEVLEYMKQWQKAKLAKGGLLDEYNAGFCKFVMGNICDWIEKTQVSGDAANPLQFVLSSTDGCSKDLVDDDCN